MEADFRETSIRATWPAATRRLGWNPTWLLLARLVLQAQGTLLAVLIARRLGEAGFGLYSLVTALVFVCNVFTTFGTDTWLIRQVAHRRRGELSEVPAALGLQLILSAGTIAALWVWTLILPPESAGFVASLRLYALSLLPLAFFSVFSALLRGLERMDLYLAVSLATASLQAMAVWLALRSGGDLPAVMAALLAVQSSAVLCSYWLCRRAAPGHRLNGRLELRPLARLIKAAWPLALLSILGVVYQRLGIFTLSALEGAAETGLYSAAARVVEASKLGHLAVLGALLPALARLQERPDKTGEARRLFKASAWVLLGLGLLGALAAFFFAAPLVQLLYGTDYYGAAAALKTLGWILLPYSLSSALAVEMVAKKREKGVAAALLASLLVAASLSIWWIPHWGIQGACLAAIAAEVAQAGVLWWLRRSDRTQNGS